MQITSYQLGRFVLLLTCSVLAFNESNAEEYMQRGASADDYEQALNRVVERHRGLMTGRERQVVEQANVLPPSPPKVSAMREPSSTKMVSSPPPRYHSESHSNHSEPRVEKTPTRVVVKAKPQPSSDVYIPKNTSSQSGDGVAIYFGYNSAQLNQAARRELDKLGQALTAPQFKGMTWVIEGHTDAAGGELYNHALSEERAQAAREYLIAQTGIKASRLIAVGKGESEPYDSANPNASINRRVRVRPE